MNNDMRIIGCTRSLAGSIGSIERVVNMHQYAAYLLEMPGFWYVVPDRRLKLSIIRSRAKWYD